MNYGIPKIAKTKREDKRPLLATSALFRGGQIFDGESLRDLYDPS